VRLPQATPAALARNRAARALRATAYETCDPNLESASVLRQNGRFVPRSTDVIYSATETMRPKRRSGRSPHLRTRCSLAEKRARTARIADRSNSRTRTVGGSMHRQHLNHSNKDRLTALLLEHLRKHWPGTSIVLRDLFFLRAVAERGLDTLLASPL
jgi:hypothetical protein